MTAPAGNPLPGLSGRIRAIPATTWYEEILAPQFDGDRGRLLPWHVAIEKALLLEYVALGVLDRTEAEAVARRLHQAHADALVADREENMSDLAFALERFVLSGLAVPVPAWHVDRSRNDIQACAQLMDGRVRLIDAAEAVLTLAAVAIDAAEGGTDTVMPGYTHLQAAQVVTPGFYLSAIAGECLQAAELLASTYRVIDRCPLGAGAMAGQELPVDRGRMALTLGFARAEPHALTSVASRGWAVAVAGDLAVLGVALSRFATDLMAWGSSEYGFIDLPDDLCGISSAMPQKKNFPILERIRGRTARLVAGVTEVAGPQRSTPYANMVEVSKEALAPLAGLFDDTMSVLRLMVAVMENLRFRPERMRAACQREHLGGFTLANLMTLRCSVPWRSAQLVAGRYISAQIEAGHPPDRLDPACLARLAAESGHRIEAGPLLAEAFDVDRALTAKQSSGSTNPESVRELLLVQREELHRLKGLWRAHRLNGSTALTANDRALGLEPAEVPT
ncbi:argininosuccinate lyase [Nonomuraea insulae]|uniref:argininosuccinate lyase n=1 Tax=Nonomuraea insulae TaxID=1616787 RepID=A0ABW1D659_9ACTN